MGGGDEEVALTGFPILGWNFVVSSQSFTWIDTQAEDEDGGDTQGAKAECSNLDKYAFVREMGSALPEVLPFSTHTELLFRFLVYSKNMVATRQEN